MKTNSIVATNEASSRTTLFRSLTVHFVFMMVVAITANRVQAADGFMIRVTAEEGHIKVGNNVLATVPKGARLWCFDVKEEGKWAEVKVPNGEQHGWIYATQLEVIKETEADKARIKEAYAHYDRYLNLKKEQKFTEAKQEIEACLSIERTVNGSDHPDVADTLNSLGNLVSDQENYLAARKYYEEALAIRRKVLGNKHPDTADTLANLGYLVSHQGDDAAARKYYEDALAIRREVLGNEHLDTATTLNNLGILAHDEEDYLAARKYYEDALAIRRKVLGNEHSTTTNTLISLGSVASDQEDYPAGRKYYEEALAIRRKVLGNEHSDTADMLRNLGYFHSRQEDYPAARKYYEEALAIRRKSLGGEHLDTATTFNDLGILANRQGDYPAARKYYEEALAIRRKVLGDEHLDTATTLNSLGSLISDEGDYAAARKYYKEALRIRRKLLGNEHSDTAEILVSLGIMENNQPDYSAAKTYLEGALDIFRKTRGNDHPDTAEALRPLGYLYRHTGKYALARKSLEEALAIFQKIYGDNHWSTATARLELARLSFELGEYSIARAHYEKALSVYRKLNGDEDRDTAGTIRELGNLLSSLGDYVAARNYLEESLRIHRAVYGDEHIQTALAFCSLGCLLTQQGDFPAARKCYEEALAIERQSVIENGNSNHLDCTLSALGELYRKQSEYPSAQKYLKESLAIRRNVYGDEDSSTASTLSSLGSLARDQGETSAARNYFEESLAIRRKVFGEEHPDTAATLSNLGELCAKDEQPTLAASYFEQSRHAIRLHQAHMLPALSEREQLLFLAENDQENFNQCISLGVWQRADARIAALSAGWLINGKAIAQEALAESALLSTSETAPLVDKLRSVRSRLAQQFGKRADATTQAEIAQLETEQQQLVRQLGAAGTGMSGEDPWVSVAALRGELQPGSVIINMARFKPYNFEAKDKTARWQNEKYVAWVIPAIDEGTVQIIDLGEAKIVDDAVGRFRDAMKKSEQAIEDEGERAADQAIGEQLATLADILWKPLANTLSDKQELLISPDGALWLVPWAAIPVENEQSLLEKYKLRYVTSGRELIQRGIERTGIGAPVVLADPDFDLSTASAKKRVGSEVVARRSASTIGNVSRLPGTAREAEAIAPSLSEISNTEPAVFLGGDATESQFKALYRPRVLVCSTHGFFLEDQQVEIEDDDLLSLRTDQQPRALLTTEGQSIENPLLRCGLLLAGCNRQEQADSTQTDDGVLSGLEIVSTDLRGTELVVLSACDTGVGEVRNGEGVAGLRQAWQFASHPRLGGSPAIDSTSRLRCGLSPGRVRSRSPPR